jgi:hypothetical protein
MNRTRTLAALVAAAALALGTTGCLQQYTAAQACQDNGGLKANSVEPENDGGGEALCNDNTEIENAETANPNSVGWVADS